MTPWTVARLTLLSMGFFRQEYWRGLLYPSSGNLPDPGIKPRSSALQVDSLPLSHQGSLSGTRVLCCCSCVDGGLINHLPSFWSELRMAHRNRCPQHTHWRASRKVHLSKGRHLLERKGEGWVEETLGEPEAGRIGEEGAVILVEESGDSGCQQKQNQLLKF